MGEEQDPELSRKLKTQDEITLLNTACTMVDAAYDELYRAMRPGFRENECVALYTELTSVKKPHLNALVNLAVILEDRGEYGRAERLRIRSMVGLLPLCAVTVYEGGVAARYPDMAHRLSRFLAGLIASANFTGYLVGALLLVIAETLWAARAGETSISAGKSA